VGPVEGEVLEAQQLGVAAFRVAISGTHH
jgi:hypothetical protein